MFELINNCCGVDKALDEFENARKTWTTPDWEVPPIQALNILLSVFRGEFQSVDPEQAINDLLAHLEQGEQRKNAAYVLKHLVLLDFIVEQRLFLNRIGHYYNSQLIYMECISQKLTASCIKDLIASYYVYIQQKAKYYQLQDQSLIDPQIRKNRLANTNSIGILNQINTCFRIQNQILDINDKFKTGNKSTPLIQFIFQLLLKTYLYCHSIVLIGLQNFTKRIPDLNHYDLQYLKKFAGYYHKDYARNFVSFLSLNKNIPSYKLVNDKNFLFFDHDRILELIKAQFSSIQHDPGICPEPEDLPLLKNTQIIIDKFVEAENLDTGIQTSGSQKEGKQRHKNIQAGLQSEIQSFKNYKNNYSNFNENHFIERAGVQQNQSPQSFMSPAQIFSYYKTQTKNSHKDILKATQQS